MSNSPKDSPPKSAEVPAQLYDAHDPIPVPEVSELDSESIWALFPGSEAASKPKQDEDPFGETVAAPLKP